MEEKVYHVVMYRERYSHSKLEFDFATLEEAAAFVKTAMNAFDPEQDADDGNLVASISYHQEFTTKKEEEMEEFEF